MTATIQKSDFGCAHRSSGAAGIAGESPRSKVTPAGRAVKFSSSARDRLSRARSGIGATARDFPSTLAGQ